MKDDPRHLHLAMHTIILLYYCIESKKSNTWLKPPSCQLLLLHLQSWWCALISHQRTYAHHRNRWSHQAARWQALSTNRCSRSLMCTTLPGPFAIDVTLTPDSATFLCMLINTHQHASVAEKCTHVEIGWMIRRWWEQDHPKLAKCDITWYMQPK